MPTAALDRCFQLLDLLGIFDLYEKLSKLLTPGLRPLKPREEALLRPVFGDSLPYGCIRIDERARFGPRQYGFSYVSFHTINTWGSMDEPTLVHEAVHVWQYVHYGALYIPRALAAQRSPAGYRYGGPGQLQARRGLHDFNYEQMAALVEDAFRLANGYAPRWAPGATLGSQACFYKYLSELRRHILPGPYR